MVDNCHAQRRHIITPMRPPKTSKRTSGGFLHGKKGDFNLNARKVWKPLRSGWLGCYAAVLTVLAVGPVVLTSTVPASGQQVQGGAATYSGRITRVSGNALEIKTASGGRTVVVNASTSISFSTSVSLNELPSGTCVSATGTEKTAARLVATSLSALTAKSTSNCWSAVRAALEALVPGGGAGPVTSGGGPPPPIGGGSHLSTGPSVAFGLITTKGATLVDLSGWLMSMPAFLGAGRAPGALATRAVTVQFGKGASVTRVRKASEGALQVGRCLSATGNVGAQGAVTAEQVVVSLPTAHGCPDKPAGPLVERA